MLRIGETKVLFEKVAEYLKCLELFEGIVPGFAVMQQNLKQHLVKVSRGWRAILQAGC